MNATLQSALKEGIYHGTADFPCAFYSSSAKGDPVFVKHHWHEEIEIIYFSSGSFDLTINMEQFSIHQECLCFINSQELHSIGISPASCETAIVFHPKLLGSDLYDSIQSLLVHPLINQQLSFPHFLYANQPYFQEIKIHFLAVAQIFSPTGKAESLEHLLKAKASLLNIMACLLEAGLLKEPTKAGSHRIESIKNVLTYIRKHYSNKIYIQDLARISSMNEQYFCRFFKQAIGKTPIQYINEIRIRKAMELLTDTNLPVMDICLECGFNNLGNFLREFKKLAKTTPLRYRKSQ